MLSGLMISRNKCPSGSRKMGLVRREVSHLFNNLEILLLNIVINLRYLLNIIINGYIYINIIVHIHLWSVL